MSEEWRVIAEWPSYAVSNLGRVKRVRPDRNGRGEGLVLKQRLGRYAYVTLRERGRHSPHLVHRLVCAAFHGAPPSPKHHAAHWDGDGLNNRADNLRWATSAENEADKARHGRTNTKPLPPERRAKGPAHGRYTKPERTARGERNGLARLNESRVTAIRPDTRPRKEVAAAYGISVTMVGFIQRGICWAHVPMPVRSGEAA